MYRKTFALAAAGCVFGVLAASPVFASPVIDVNSWNTAGKAEMPVYWDTNRGDHTQSLAQSFTAGKSGLLSSVDLQLVSLATPTAVTLSVFAGSITDKASLRLGQSGSLYGFGYFNWSANGMNYPGISVDVQAQNISVVENQTYTVVVEPIFGSPGTMWYKQGFTGWITGGPSVGTAFSQVDGGAWTALADTTFGIRTFVDASAGAVPEPATWAMMMIGFGGMGAAIRRRKRRVSVRFA